jgi:hypothetical protein
MDTSNDTELLQNDYQPQRQKQFPAFNLKVLLKQTKHSLRKAAAFNHPSEKMLLARLNKIGLIAKILDIPETDIMDILGQN